MEYIHDLMRRACCRYNSLRFDSMQFEKFDGRIDWLGLVLEDFNVFGQRITDWGYILLNELFFKFVFGNWWENISGIADWITMGCSISLLVLTGCSVINYGGNWF